MKDLKIKSNTTDGDIITAKDLNINISLGTNGESININFKKSLKLIDGSFMETQGNVSYSNYQSPTSEIPQLIEVSEEQKALELTNKIIGEKVLKAIKLAVSDFITAHEKSV